MNIHIGMILFLGIIASVVPLALPVGRNFEYEYALVASILLVGLPALAAVFVPRFVAKLHNQKSKEAYQLIEYEQKLPLPARYIHQPIYIVKRKSDVENAEIKKIAAALRMLTTES